MRRQAALAVAFWLGVLAIRAWPQEELETAYDLIRRGEFTSAEQMISARLKAAPLNADALAAKGFLLAQQGNHTGAIGAARKALSLQPAHAFAHTILALSLLATGQRDEGIRELETLTRAHADNAGGWRNLGLAYLQAGLPDKAVPALRKRLELVPDDDLVRIDFTSALIRLGRHREARQVMNQISRDAELEEKLCQALLEAEWHPEVALRLEAWRNRAPLTPAMTRQLAEALAASGSLAESERLLAGIREPARDAHYALAAAWAQILREDLPGAVRTIQQAIRREPAEARLYHALAMVLLRGGAALDAVDASEQGLARQPDSAILWFSLGMANEYLERHGEAQNALLRSIELDPSNGLGHYVLALSYSIGSQEWAMVEASYRAAMRARPQDNLILNNWARELAKRQKWDEAEAAARELIQRPGHEATGHDVLARAAAARGKADEALRHFEMAVEAGSEDFGSAYRFAMELMRRGEHDKAREQLVKFRSSKTAAEERERERAVLVRLARF